MMRSKCEGNAEIQRQSFNDVIRVIDLENGHYSTAVACTVSWRLATTYGCHSRYNECLTSSVTNVYSNDIYTYIRKIRLPASVILVRVLPCACHTLLGFNVPWGSRSDLPTIPHEWGPFLFPLHARIHANVCISYEIDDNHGPRRM